MDLNNLYSGFFGMATAATAQAYTNNPLSSKATGILVKNYSVNGIYYQEVTGTLAGGMYKRRKSGDTWSDWIQMATTSDNVASATKLATGRTLKVNLASTAASTAFNGTANITDIGVAGVLPIANGGTGSTTAAAARTALGITPANIGAAASSHTHSYLPLSGGTMSGTLNFADNIGISGLMGGGSDGWTLCGSGTNDAGILKLTISDNATSDFFDIVFDDWDADPVTSFRFGGANTYCYTPLYIQGNKAWHGGNLKYSLSGTTLTITTS